MFCRNAHRRRPDSLKRLALKMIEGHLVFLASAAGSTAGFAACAGRLRVQRRCSRLGFELADPGVEVEIEILLSLLCRTSSSYCSVSIWPRKRAFSSISSNLPGQVELGPRLLVKPRLEASLDVEIWRRAYRRRKVQPGGGRCPDEHGAYETCRPSPEAPASVDEGGRPWSELALPLGPL